MHFDHGRFVDPQHVVLIEVALLHAAFVDRDFAFQRRRQSVDDGAADLLLEDRGIDDMSAIDRADHAMNPHLALC